MRLLLRSQCRGNDSVVSLGIPRRTESPLRQIQNRKYTEEGQPTISPYSHSGCPLCRLRIWVGLMGREVKMIEGFHLYQRKDKGGG